MSNEIIFSSICCFISLIVFLIFVVGFYFTFTRYSLIDSAIDKGDYTTATALASPEISSLIGVVGNVLRR
jgi:hypothetical protein